MTSRERVLEAIRAHWAKHGFGPSYGEIAAAAGLAGRPTVLYHLRRLRADGLVDYNDRQARTVRLVEKAKA